MKHLYHIKLDKAQHDELENIVRRGQANIHTYRHAFILLKAAAGQTDQKIAQALQISQRTVLRCRQRFCQAGLAAALYNKKPSGPAKKYDEGVEAFVIATACSPAPVGQARWTLRLLASHLVELGLGQTISPETVRNMLKKTNCSLIERNAGSSPGE